MTTIEWTRGDDGALGKTWNPVTGCTKVSPGCAHCYAETVAARFWAKQYPFIETRDGSFVDGLRAREFADVQCHEDRLDAPLRWRKPRRVFVNSMSDLFHKDVPDEFIDRVFAVMALTPQHVFQCLTKRAERMRLYMSAADLPNRIAKAIDAVLVDREHEPIEKWAEIPGYSGYEASTHGNVRSANGALSTGQNPRCDREQVTLWNQGEPRTWFIHALVLMAWRGLPSEGQEARHRNGDKGDNRLANLLWGTRSENQQDKVRHGAIGGPQKLTREQTVEIRHARAKGATQQSVADRFGVSRSLVSMIESGDVWGNPFDIWPLRNVWLGCSVENQHFADERIPLLLQTPAAVRFVSAEPLLGPVNVEPFLQYPPLHDDHKMTFGGREWRGLDWVIAGGESGSGARPCDLAWIRSIVAQCKAAGLPAFVKQLGAVPIYRTLPPFNGAQGLRSNGEKLKDRKGGDPSEWPADLRVRQFPVGRERIA